MFDSVSRPIPIARAMARATGRVEELRRLERESERLIDSLLKRPVWRRRWAAVEADWKGRRELDPEDWGRTQRALEALLRTVVCAALTSEAVADVLTSEQLVQARGPLLTARFGAHGELPGEEWAAPYEVVRQVVAWLEPLEMTGLWLLGALHRAPGRGEDGYLMLSLKLSAFAATSASGCPWEDCLERCRPSSVRSWSDDDDEFEPTARVHRSHAGPAGCRYGAHLGSRPRASAFRPGRSRRWWSAWAAPPGPEWSSPRRP